MDDCVACSVRKKQNDEIFCQLGVASPVYLPVVCFGSSISAGDMNRIIEKANSAIASKLVTFEAVVKLWCQ